MTLSLLRLSNYLEEKTESHVVISLYANAESAY